MGGGTRLDIAGPISADTTQDPQVFLGLWMPAVLGCSSSLEFDDVASGSLKFHYFLVKMIRV